MPLMAFKFNIISPGDLSPTMTIRRANLNMYICKGFCGKFQKFDVKRPKFCLYVYITDQNKIFDSLHTLSLKVIRYKMKRSF